MSDVTDRALFLLISSWRNQAEYLESTGQEGAADQMRICASMLEQEAGFCAVCGGRGVESSEAFEDEPGGWFPCSMCDGSGRARFSHQCAECGEFDREALAEEISPGVWNCCRCMSWKRLVAEKGYPPMKFTWSLPLGERV